MTSLVSAEGRYASRRGGAPPPVRHGAGAVLGRHESRRLGLLFVVVRLGLFPEKIPILLTVPLLGLPVPLELLAVRLGLLVVQGLPRLKIPNLGVIYRVGRPG